MKPSVPRILSALLLLMSLSPAPSYSSACPESTTDWIRVSPQRPEPGDTLRIKAISTRGGLTEIRLETRGEQRTVNSHPTSGPPWVLDATATLPSSGQLRILAMRNDEVVACQDLEQSPSQEKSSTGWTRSDEAFYSAWIAQLFDGPAEEELSFRSLEPVIRDPRRNFLYGHLGNDEDRKLPATPDCADLPYFLRAYFAWKVGLPVAYRSCDRGTGSRPPHCGSATIDTRFSTGTVSASAFSQFSHKLFDTVHSGSARTGINDDSTDFFPLALQRDALWPGTVYADPYGHTLILVKWIKAQDGKPGILLAADAQPDNSVTRKRFWEGNFLFADIPGAGAGFKAFRPIIWKAGRYASLSNSDLERQSYFGTYSAEQSHLEPDDFYAKVEKAINPDGLRPLNAYTGKLDALTEQVRTRVQAVENGQRWARTHPGTIIPMPQGSQVFETTGAWEDFASPSRDMRLLIALRVVAKFSDSVRQHPDLFRLDNETPESAAEEVERYHNDRIREIRFDYVRTDGTPYTLTLEALFNRRSSLETGYNPNDCAERRWGAAPGTEEYRPCTRLAPADQQARMEKYRPWFQSMQRPTR